MMLGSFPESLKIGDAYYQLRSDYRDVLQVFQASSDPELEQWEKWIVAIYLLLEPFTCADDVFAAAENGFDIQEAGKQIVWFLSGGTEPGGKKELPTYDWMQDEQMIFSAVNKVAGQEVREAAYMHWWTFLGYFNEVGEGNLTYIVGIRRKINKRKNLEKHEKEFLNSNRSLVELKKRKSREEREQEAMGNAILDKLIE